MAILNVGKDFSTDPIGRYRTDSKASGEAFREDALIPALKKLQPNDKLQIILDDGVESYGSSFLTEGFAGAVKYGYYTKEQLLELIEIKYSEDDFKFYSEKIYQYIKEAIFNSQKYVPSKK